MQNNAKCTKKFLKQLIRLKCQKPMIAAKRKETYYDATVCFIRAVR